MRNAILTKRERLAQRAEKTCRWHLHFALLPVLIKDEHGITHRVQFEKIGRKGKVITGYQEGPYIGHWEYCFKEDIIANALKDDEIRDSDGNVFDTKDLL